MHAQNFVPLNKLFMSHGLHQLKSYCGWFNIPGKNVCAPDSFTVNYMLNYLMWELQCNVLK